MKAWGSGLNSHFLFTNKGCRYFLLSIFLYYNVSFHFKEKINEHSKVLDRALLVKVIEIRVVNDFY